MNLRGPLELNDSLSAAYQWQLIEKLLECEDERVFPTAERFGWHVSSSEETVDYLRVQDTFAPEEITLSINWPRYKIRQVAAFQNLFGLHIVSSSQGYF